MSRTAARNLGLRSETCASILAERRLTKSGSWRNCPRKQALSAVLRAQSKSPAAASHAISPSVTTIMKVSSERCAIHHSISFDTHGDRADSVDASSTKYAERDNARSMAGQSTGGDIELLSRKTRNGSRYHGFPTRRNAECRTGASLLSAAWLYDTNALNGVERVSLTGHRRIASPASRERNEF